MYYNKTKQKSGNLFIYYFPILFILCYSYIILQMPHVFEDIYIYIYIYIQKVFRPPYIFYSLLYCSHLLKSFKFIFFLINVHTAPHIYRKTQNCWHFCRFIKKEKLKYHMVLSNQTLCCDTHIFNSGAVHFFWSSLRWFYTFIWVQLCLIILIGLD